MANGGMRDALSLPDQDDFIWRRQELTLDETYSSAGKSDRRLDD